MALPFADYHQHSFDARPLSASNVMSLDALPFSAPCPAGFIFYILETVHHNLKGSIIELILRTLMYTLLLCTQQMIENLSNKRNALMLIPFPPQGQGRESLGNA
jgi:hypothetical protein